MNVQMCFGNLRSRIGQLVATALLALALTGCEDLATTQMLSGLANIESKTELDDFVQRAFVRGDYTGVFGVRTGILSTAELYVSWDEFRALIVDTDSFLKYGLGLIMTRYPELTYDDLRNARSDSRFPAEEVITPEEFEYYRIWGQTYLDQIKSRPENAYLIEREQLFMARAKRDPWLLLSGLDYSNLLRDDEMFVRFLTDDRFAATLLSKNLEESFDPEDLGPIYTGVTPGTGS